MAKTIFPPIPPSDAGTVSAAPAYCRRCGYSLRGLTGGKCPECGGAFDPSDRRTFARRPPRTWLRLWAWRAAALLVCLTMAAASVPGWYWWGWHREQKAIGELRRLGAWVGARPVGPLELPKYLPQRWWFVLYRADSVGLEGGPAGKVQRLDFTPLVHLDTIDLQGNAVDDNILGQFAGMTELRGLHLLDNKLDGSGFSHLAQCSKLSQLNVAYTSLNDAGLTQVGKLTSLEYLNASRTQVTDAGMVHLTSLTSLKRLDLVATAITDGGIIHLARLNSLQELDLGRTAITDGGLLQLRGLTALRKISVWQTKVTAQGKREFKTFLPNVTFK